MPFPLALAFVSVQALFTVQLAQLPVYSVKQLEEQSWLFKKNKISAIFIPVNSNFLKCSEHPGVENFELPSSWPLAVLN